MIGSRASAAAAVLATAVALGGGAPRPEVEAAARAAVVAAAGEALAALADLRERLLPAMDAARAGAAAVVAGEDAPGGPLREAAAAVLDGGVPAAETARDALERLRAARGAFDPAAAAMPLAPDPAELSSIAGQLADTADAGDGFAAMRRRAEELTATLDAGLKAAVAVDLRTAAERVAEASADLERLRAWELGSDTLPVWIDTVDAMIDAMDRTLGALEAGDAAAAAAAAADFAALADEAPSADRALRIALGEAGSAVTASALGRLAAALEATDALTAAVASVRDETAR